MHSNHVMDPLYVSTPRDTGTFALPHEPGVTLYYELRGNSTSATKVVLLMGSLATTRHVDELADRLVAATGGELLSFDWRGIGRSTASERTRLRSQTSRELALDAHALLSHTWGAGESSGDIDVHVYGASMGGMVAQRLALLLLHAQKSSRLQLRSLTLAVTASCYGLARFMPLPACFYRFMLPLALPSDPGTMVASLLPKVFAPEYLNSRHPRT